MTAGAVRAILTKGNPPHNLYNVELGASTQSLEESRRELQSVSFAGEHLIKTLQPFVSPNFLWLRSFCSFASIATLCRELADRFSQKPASVATSKLSCCLRANSCVVQYGVRTPRNCLYRRLRTWYPRSLTSDICHHVSFKEKE